MKTAKILASSLALVIFSGAMIGCESTDLDTRTTKTTTTYDDGSKSTYKKTTYTNDNGDTTVKTEKTEKTTRY